MALKYLYEHKININMKRLEACDQLTNLRIVTLKYVSTISVFKSLLFTQLQLSNKKTLYLFAHTLSHFQSKDDWSFHKNDKA